MFKALRRFIIGEPRNPFNPQTRHSIALIAFLAWIGLGADGLSSSAYGPEQAFLALGSHTHLALYLAPVMIITVFIISLAYNQVIELFPNGGGGYKAATALLGKYFGLVAGLALLIDYALTIAISLSSGMDAIFSFLPNAMQQYKLTSIVLSVILLTLLNLRGMKESIKILLPIFLGFFITHFMIICYGFLSHGTQFPTVVHEVTAKTVSEWHGVGTLVLFAMFFRAYAIGGATYTGLEAVSNNVHILAAPRVRTGKWTMFYMASSLGFTAAGILLLYLLWHVQPVPNKTLNAVVFGDILQNWPLHHAMLVTLLLFEAGLLFVGANTGFLGGPAVLANMSLDRWVPSRFSNLSSRLVIQNGILLFGLGALATILWSNGSVTLLVVLYSMNVFLAFSLTICGLVVYWCRNRTGHWIYRLLLSTIGFVICVTIFLLILITKFDEGGWVTILLIAIAIVTCLFIKRHYKHISKKLKVLDKQLTFKIPPQTTEPPKLDPSKPTAVFIIDRISLCMHSLLWVQRMFPDHFKNFVFISSGIVDVGSYNSERKLNKIEALIKRRADYFVRFTESHNIAAKAYDIVGTDPVAGLTKVCRTIAEDFPNAIFFAAKLIFPRANWLVKLLHDDTMMILQRRLHLRGQKMLILPMNIN